MGREFGHVFGEDKNMPSWEICREFTVEPQVLA